MARPSKGSRPFKIGTTTIPTPTEYEFSIEDLSSEETGRTLDGNMHKDVVNVKATFTCTWAKLSWEDASTLLTAINGKTKVKFTHADPRDASGFIEGWYYVGQRGGAALDLTDSARNWTNISFQFIEV